MAINSRVAPQRSLRWRLLRGWMLVSLIGIIIGTTLYRLLPDELVNPLEDENIWLEQPWRLALMNAVYYAPIIFAQWLLLWRYVRQAWWWPTVILGSVIVIYPATIWMFENLGLLFLRGGLGGPAAIAWELSWAVWFLGLGGSSIFVIAQWLAMLRWRRTTATWAVGCVTTTLGWLLILSVIALFSADLASSPPPGDGWIDQLQAIGYAGLYQLTIGGVLVASLQSNLQHKVTQTTPG